MTGPVCAACGEAEVQLVLRVPLVPVYSNVLHASRDEALAVPRGELELVACERCGHGFNRAYREPPPPVPTAYEGSQAHSPRFQRYVNWECDRLVDRWGMRGRKLIEVGCGDGTFLHSLCERGVDGIGFDPSWCAPSTSGSRARFIRDDYGPAWFQLPADGLMCRHTLEHVADPLALMRMLVEACAVSGARRVFLEVPDFTRIIALAAFWDVYYEHCSYFTPASLTALVTRAGFDVLEQRRVFDDQYVSLVAEPARTGAVCQRDGDSPFGRERATAFSERCTRAARAWDSCIRERSAAGHEIVLWGAGSKAAGFLAHLEQSEAIRFIVDINPRKQGTFQAGGGQEVIAPQRLVQVQPDLVIIMNAGYADEIRANLLALGIAPAIATL